MGTGLGQRHVLGLIQGFDPIRPKATAVLATVAQDFLEEGRRNLVMLFVGLFRNQGDGGRRHVAQEVQHIAVGGRRVFKRQGIQAFPRELADAEPDGPIRQQAAFSEGNKGLGSGHGGSIVRGAVRKGRGMAA